MLVTDMPISVGTIAIDARGRDARQPFFAESSAVTATDVEAFVVAVVVVTDVSEAVVVSNISDIISPLSHT